MRILYGDKVKGGRAKVKTWIPGQARDDGRKGKGWIPGQARDDGRKIKTWIPGLTRDDEVLRV